MPEKPTAQAYAIGAQLRRLREARGLSQEQVTRQLSTPDNPLSSAKLSRIEGGRSRIKPDDVRRLLELYRAPTKVRRYLIDMTGLQSRRSTGFWREYPGHQDYNVPQFLLLEAHASWVGNLEPVLIPGLLQTREYGTTLLSAARAPDPERVAREWESRHARQARVDRGDLRAQFLIGQTALGLEWLAPRHRVEQLDKVRQAAERPNISMRIIPHTVLAPATYGNQLAILRFPDEGLPDVVYTEHFNGSWVIDDPAALIGARDRYDRVSAMCLTEHESRQMIADMLRNVPS